VETRAIFSTVLDEVGLPFSLDEPAQNLVAVAESPTSETAAGESRAAFTSVWMTDAPIHSEDASECRRSE
jgi:hypothetical protein